MEIEENCKKRNKILSQSYIEGVGRVAQQNNDVGFGFELPKEVIEKREKVWDNLFDKYADEVSDEIELNIDTMEPIETAGEEDETEEEEEEETEEYYSKCRAPMKKHSSSIQYWIDTGNHPYKLEYDNNSGTGSSLSEGENSNILEESNDKEKFDNLSRYSSVDTAAYILSNTNTTKKIDTLAIVEISKNDKIEKNLTNINNSLITNENISHERSVKLKEVLPTFKQFDDIFEISQMNRQNNLTNDICLISDLKTKSLYRRKFLTVKDSSIDLETTKNRRRNLHFERDSPIDLSPENNLENIELSKNFHDIFNDNLTNKNSSLRERAKRKRKKISKSKIHSDNSSKESLKKIYKKISKGDERYTDFFESLGLTPSKTIIGDDLLKKSQKRSKKNDKFENKRKIKKIKLSETSKFDELNNDKKSIINDKILCVKIEKLSDNLLKRYCKKFQTNQEIFHSEDKNLVKKNIKNYDENIELLNMANQDSDSSTILICACNNDNNDNYYDSDNSMIMKKVKKKLSINEKNQLTKSLRRKKKEDNERNKYSTISSKSKNFDKIELSKSRKLYVSIEKLSMKNNENSSINLMNNSTNDKKIFEKFDNNLKISISSDDDEDSFVKIVKDYDSKNENEKFGKINDDENNKKLNNFDISIKSDDDLSTKNLKKIIIDESKDRRKKIDEIDINNKIVTRSTRKKKNYKESKVNEKKFIENSLNLARFKTRLDSDSDTDFESLKFSINPNSDKTNETIEINKKSFRRSLRNLNDNKLKSMNIKKNLSTREKALKKISKNVKTKIEIKEKFSNRLRNIKKNSSSKFDKKKSSSIDKKKSKFFDRIEYESDDDKLIVQNSNSIENNNSLKKHSKNVFSIGFDETVDDIDNLFLSNDKSRGKQCKVVIDSLNFLPSNKYQNLNVKKSTISFRTKFRSDSDDENAS